MNENTRKILDIRLEKVKKALIYNNMDARILENKEQVIEEIKRIIPDKANVNVGGSQSLIDCGVISLLEEMDVTFDNRHKEGLSREQLETIYKNAFSCDYYLASSNAVTEEGELYNVDGRSNRVAAISYGPEHVILVVGENKIVKDLEEAKKRVERIAAPTNCVRLNRENACTVAGECKNCHSDKRICCTFVTHKWQMIKNRIIVLLVKENLGY